MNTKELVRADRVVWVRPRIAGKGHWMSLLDYYTGNPSFPGDLLLSRRGAVAYIPLDKHGPEAIEFALDDVTEVKDIHDFYGGNGLQIRVLGLAYRIAFTGSRYVSVVSHHPTYHRQGMGYVPKGENTDRDEVRTFWRQVFSGDMDLGQLPLLSDIQ
jgi:hypothetical protein